MPHGLEAVSLGTAGRELEPGIGAIQRLDRGLLIDAEHHGMLRRLEVEADDVGGFGLEVGIRARLVALQPMRPQAVPLPHRRDGGVGEPQPGRQAATRPVGQGGTGGAACTVRRTIFASSAADKPCPRPARGASPRASTPPWT